MTLFCRRDWHSFMRLKVQLNKKLFRFVCAWTCFFVLFMHDMLVSEVAIEQRRYTVDLHFILSPCILYLLSYIHTVVYLCHAVYILLYRLTPFALDLSCHEAFSHWICNIGVFLYNFLLFESQCRFNFCKNVCLCVKPICHAGDLFAYFSLGLVKCKICCLKLWPYETVW